MRLLKAWISAWKTGTGCSKCGYNEHPAALDFDHRPGTTKLYRMASCGVNAFLEELPKCDLLCANCHRIATYERLTDAVN